MNRLTAANEQVQQLIDMWKDIQIEKFRVEEAEKKILQKYTITAGALLGDPLLCLRGCARC